MMDFVRAAQLMSIERKCVIKAAECSRDCENCELVQDSEELIQAYETAHWALLEMNKLVDGGYYE